MARDGGPAITVSGLHKRYGAVEAVHGIDLTVARGEVFALLGPNGAGKTTTLEILEGYRRRDAGDVSVLGFDPADGGRPMRERIGIVLQETAVDPYLTVREVLTRNAGYYPRPRRVADVIDLVGMAEKADARVNTLSGGQQRRLDVGLGIIGSPELLFLDEPTTGFDPSARRGAWELVRNLTGAGATIVLTTHYMDEAQALAHRVAVIAGGRILAEGPPNALGGRNRATTSIRFQLPVGVSVADLPVSGTLAGDTVTLEVDGDDSTEILHRLTGWSLTTGHALGGLIVDRPSLEDIYLRLVGAEA
jgi:ABC-2 type transport system ATP-binding protein